ncbi:MAG: aldolase [Oscillospiraceae bacterium]|nr:aldolase [Oscillospiraceae bacterium]
MYEVGRLHRKFAENRGKLTIGTHIRSQDPCISELLANLGFDMLWIENEHSNLDKYQTTLHTMAAQAGGAAAIVRVPWNDPVLIKPILELGVDGIVIPMICSAQEARDAIAACTYPPDGVRGMGPIRSNNYGLVDTAEYLSNSDRQIFKILQIEHIDGVNHVEEILDVPGVDAVIVGQFDLSGSLGILGQIYDERNLNQIRKVFAACNRRGIPCGISSEPTERALNLWTEMGIDFVFLCYEYDWIRIAAGNALGMARKFERK